MDWKEQTKMQSDSCIHTLNCHYTSANIPILIQHSGMNVEQ